MNVGDITIKPKERYVKSVYIPKGRDVILSFRADDPLNVWMVHSEEWRKFLDDTSYNFENPLVKRKETKRTIASFHTSMNDLYYLDLKNNHWVQKVTVYNVNMVANWQETKVGYRTEKECRKVTKYKTKRQCN